MAYDENTVDRVRKIMQSRGVSFEEKKMFSGICFMVDEKMCCGCHIDKKTNENILMCRVSEEVADAAIEKGEADPMNFTGRPMKGYVFVSEHKFQNQAVLEKWIERCLEFNPIAKKSKK